MAGRRSQNNNRDQSQIHRQQDNRHHDNRQHSRNRPSNQHNNDRQCTLCHRSGHARDTCRQNPKNFKCTNVNCKSRWSHETSQCGNSNGGDTRESCSNCGKRGHVAENCRSRTKQVADVLMTSPVDSSQPYCILCNSTGHETNKCTAPSGFRLWSQSLLKCTRCREKGHSHDECRNPKGKGKRCSKCLWLGHSRDECPHKNSKELKSPATPSRNAFETLDRAKIGSHARFRLADYSHLHETQKERLELEKFEYDMQFAKASMSDAERLHADRQIEQWRRQLEAKERRIFPRSPAVNSLPDHDMGGMPVFAPVQQYYVPTTNVAPARTSVGPASGARRPSVSRSNLVKYISRHGLNGSDPEIQEFVRQQVQIAERNIINKISNSRLGYQASGIWNQFITLNELSILEAGLVTQARMNQIKRLILDGAIIHRDPMTIAALFARKVPVCAACGTRGVIVDEHFQPVPVDAPATDMYLLRDVAHPGWGLFIVFRCRYRCSRDGYRFIPVPIEEMNGKDMQGDPLYFPYGDI